MVQWLHKHQVKVTKAAMGSAIIAGHLEIVIWLHNNRSEGYTDVIKRYPHSKAMPFPTPMDFAESWNHIDIVKWLHVNKPQELTKYAMNIAAARGCLEMVQ